MDVQIHACFREDSVSSIEFTMPPKSKRSRQSAAAAAKGREKQQEAKLVEESRELVHEPMQSGTDIYVSNTIVPLQEVEALETSTQTPTLFVSEPGPSSSVGEEPQRNSFDILEEFVEGWVSTLDRDDKKSLAMLLCYTLVKEFAFTETRAAETTGKIIKKSDKTVRRWRTDLITNNGTFSESKQLRSIPTFRCSLVK